MKTAKQADVQPLLEGLCDAVERRIPLVEFDVLFDSLVLVYVDAEDTGRERIREAVRLSPWAALGLWPRREYSFFTRFRDERQLIDLKRALILESILERDDPRDTAAAVSDLVYWAKVRNLEPSSILREVAQVSSTKSMLGTESFRAMLLRMAGA